MQYDKKMTELSKLMIVTSVFEFSHKSTENIFVVDEHNYFNSQPKVDTEEQIKFFIVSQDTNFLSDLAKKGSRTLDKVDEN